MNVQPMAAEIRDDDTVSPAEMRRALVVAAETWNTVDEWLGSASTRQAGMDALWRLRRALERVGIDVNDSIRGHLSWRGSLVRAMDAAGIGVGADGIVRLRRPDQPTYERASGEPIADVIARALEMVPDPSPIDPRPRGAEER